MFLTRHMRNQITISWKLDIANGTFKRLWCLRMSWRVILLLKKFCPVRFSSVMLLHVNRPRKCKVTERTMECIGCSCCFRTAGIRWGLFSLMLLPSHVSSQAFFSCQWNPAELTIKLALSLQKGWGCIFCIICQFWLVLLSALVVCKIHLTGQFDITYFTLELSNHCLLFGLETLGMADWNWLALITDHVQAIIFFDLPCHPLMVFSLHVFFQWCLPCDPDITQIALQHFLGCVHCSWSFDAKLLHASCCIFNCQGPENEVRVSSCN